MLIVVIVYLVTYASTFDATGTIEEMFIADMRSAPRGTVGYAIDVGANTGTWSWQWRRWCAEMGARDKVIEVHTFEPQVTFSSRLTNQTAKMNAQKGCRATFYPAAAQEHDGFAHIVARKAGIQTATVTMIDAPRAAGKYGSVTPALDLGRFLQDLLPQAESISLLKLDVEGGEFTLLPWLLLHGAICRLRYLHLEWHLNKLAPEERLAGLALRLTLHTLLEHGCDIPPASIFHDAATQNNIASSVPGLLELGMLQSMWHQNDTHRFGRGLNHHDLAHVEARLAAADGHSIPPSETPQSRCRMLAQKATLNRRSSNNSRPSCIGACPAERMLEDPYFASVSVKRTYAQTLSRRDVIESVPCFPLNA